MNRFYEEIDLKLYVYEHCPFCVRARMIFGLNNVPVELVMLPNDDEETPIAMTGKKMLPILEISKKETIDESLDIVHYIAEIRGASCLSLGRDSKIESWAEDASKTIYELAIPRWAYSDFPEFASISARQYFIDKKQGAFGGFSALVARTPALLDEINQRLVELDVMLRNKDNVVNEWSLTDVILFPVVRSLSIVKGVEWPRSVDEWRCRLASQSGILLHDEVAI